MKWNKQENVSKRKSQQEVGDDLSSGVPNLFPEVNTLQV